VGVLDISSVTVVIVSYNTREALRRSLESLDPSYEVIVVDNASSDGSAEMVSRDFPRVKLIANKENVGFGRANNQGMDVASSELVLLLNSDAYVKGNAIAILASVFEDPKVIVAGGRLEHPDGRLQESAANELTLWAVFCEQLWLEKLAPNSGIFSPYWVSRRLVSRGVGPFDVAQVMGACLMLRSRMRFDDRFFLYCEDTELCYRLHGLGRILYVPAAEFVHELGTSSSKERWRAIAMYNVGKELYFRIHRGRFAAFVCWVIDRKGAFLRLVAWSVAMFFTLGLSARFRRQAYTFWKVFFAGSSYSALRSS